MKNFNADLNIVLNAVRKTSIRISRDFYEIEKLQVSKKGVADFVTNIDFKAEKILSSSLRNARPEYSFLTEESGELQKLKDSGEKDTEYKWIIDPIDGTFNFMHGIPFFCISIALIKIKKNKTSVLLGVISNPSNNEIFWAGKNMGSYLINHLGTHRKIKITRQSNFELMICAIHDNPSRTGKIKNYIEYVQKKNSKIRIFGASALEMAYLADARINLLIQEKMNIWDYAAGLLLIREAGGVIRDLNGKDFQLNVNSGIIAGNEKAVNEIEKNSLDV